MPLINVRVIENVFTPEQEQQMARDLIGAMAAIEGARCAAPPGGSSRKSQAATGPSAAGR